MLIREGQYSETCDHPEKQGEICPNQMIRLQSMFTVGQFLLSFVSLPVGWIVDHAPKPLYYSVTAIVEVAGLFVLGLSDSQSSFDYFVVGYGLMALGGNLTMLGAFPASFLLPEYQTGILAANSCLFDASSIAFFVFYRLNIAFGWSRKDIFMVYAVVSILVYTALGICWYVLEQKDWKHVVELESAAAAESTQDDSEDDMQDEVNSNISVDLQRQKLLTQLKSREFALITCFTAAHMLRANLYIMTVDDLLRFMGDVTGLYANIFSFVLPCGVIFVPVIDYTVRRMGVLKTLHLTNLLGVIFGAFLCIPILGIQIATFGFFACFRAYLYATANTFIAVYFGVETMGRVIGVTFTSAAIVSLTQYPIAIFAGHGYWLEVNWIMLGVCVLPILLVVFYKETQPHELPKRASFAAYSPALPISLSQRMSERLSMSQRLREDF